VPDQAVQEEADVPIRAITSGPKFHWFGYYDKFQFDPSGRFVLGMEVDFEGRSPEPDDVIKLGMIDLAEGDKWTELGQTRAWCWQQGCMLQWLPGSETKVIWNDRDGDRFVCRVMDVGTGATKTLQCPVYTVSADGTTGVAPDFRRVNHMRPGYGYNGPPDPYKEQLAPKDSGIWRLDLQTGRSELIISIADVAAIPYPHADLSGYRHYFNHLLFNPDGSRFIFLHRWRPAEGGPSSTRMLTAAPDGSDVRVVDDYGHTSHFIWRDPEHILAWGYHPLAEWAFYLYEDGTREVEAVGREAMAHDGHCTYLAGEEWIVNDGYPQGGKREAYLYHVPTGRRVSLGRFDSPEVYSGEWRCDLHPRHSPDGSLLTIDSVHEGIGRQIYLLDVSEIAG